MRLFMVPSFNSATLPYGAGAPHGDGLPALGFTTAESGAANAADLQSWDLLHYEPALNVTNLKPMPSANTTVEGKRLLTPGAILRLQIT